MRAFVVIFAVIAATCAYGQEYEPSVFGMQSLSLICDTESKLAMVRKYDGLPGFDFLRIPQSRVTPVEVLVGAEQSEDFKRVLEANEIEYKVIVQDVSKIVETEFRLQKRALMRRSRAGVSLKSFPRYDEIKTYLESLGKSNSNVEAFSIGKSFEGRDIVGVKFSSGGENKPALFMDAGIHSREWIAPTTALYAIKQLAENASNSYLFDNIDIYIVPLLNPDGYEYTHKSVATRMWRKTRSVRSNSRCVGVDANRNFELEWMTVGASSNPCSDTYAGPSPFSEPETAALRDFILARKGLIKVYLTFHSYGNYLLHPWGFTEDLPKNEPVLSCVAKAAEAELAKVRGTRYEIGSSTNVLYAASGGSDDWAMGTAGADLSYTVELPGGIYGFAPPPSQILPVGRETFEAIRIIAGYVDGKVCQQRR